MLASIAEFETEIRKERQMEGIAKAQEKGVQFGRKPRLTAQKIQELKKDRKQGITISSLMTHYSLSKASIYRLLAE